MDEKKVGQIAVSGLVFALLGFVMSVALGVYVLYYQKDDGGDDKAGMSRMYARSYQAPPIQSMQSMRPPRSPPAQTFQPTALAQPPAGPTQPLQGFNTSHKTHTTHY
jgi:hypothetical protein